MLRKSYKRDERRGGKGGHADKTLEEVKVEEDNDKRKRKRMGKDLGERVKGWRRIRTAEDEEEELKDKKKETDSGGKRKR